MIEASLNYLGALFTALADAERQRKYRMERELEARQIHPTPLRLASWTAVAVGVLYAAWFVLVPEVSAK